MCHQCAVCTFIPQFLTLLRRRRDTAVPVENLTLDYFPYILTVDEERAFREVVPNISDLVQNAQPLQPLRAQVCPRLLVRRNPDISGINIFFIQPSLHHFHHFRRMCFDFILFLVHRLNNCEGAG